MWTMISICLWHNILDYYTKNYMGDHKTMPFLNIPILYYSLLQITLLFLYSFICLFLYA